MSPSTLKRYLGDGVYVDLDQWRGIVLTTWNGLADTNTIVLEQEVLREFERWLRDLRMQPKEEPPEAEP